MLLSVEHMQEDHKFYRLLEDDLDMIEGFYNQQLESSHKRLYELIQQLIQLGLMESYVPNEYPSLDKTPRVAFLGGSLDAVLLDSDDEDAADKLNAEFVQELDARLKGKQDKKNGKRRSKKQRKKNKKNKKRKQEGSDEDDGGNNIDDNSDDDSNSDDDDSDDSDSDSDDDDENDEDELTESEQETSEEERSQGKSNGLVGSLSLKLKLSRDALSRLNNRAAGATVGGGDDDAYGDDDADDDDGAREEGDTQPKPSIAAEKLRQHREDIENRRLERIRKYATGVTKRPLKSVISSHQAFGTKRRGSAGKAKSPTPNDDDAPTDKMTAIQRLLTAKHSRRRRNKNDSSAIDLETSTVRLKGNEIVVFPSTAKLTKEERKKARKTLSFAFKEYYRGLCLLDSYCRVNLEGFNNVLKKHDKVLGTTSRLAYMKQIKKQHDFIESRRLQVLKAETERVFALCFTKGSRRDGMRKLRVPLRKKPIGWSTFRLGFASGLSIMFFAIVVCLFVYTEWFDGTAPMQFSEMTKVYRMIWLTVLLNWLWGLDMYIWNMFRVNYALIFKFDIRSHVRWQQLLESAAIFTVIWVFSVLLYLISGAAFFPLGWMHDVPWQVFPFSLFVLLLVVILAQQIKADCWLAKRMLRIFRAPFVPVEFADVFFADQLCSLVLFFQDFWFTSCFFAYDAWIDEPYVCTAMDPYVKPLIAMIPYGLRLLQCLRRYRDTKDWWNLVNAGKYMSSILVTVFSTLRTFYVEQGWLVLWVCGVLLSTMYTYTWDLRKDWNVAHTKAKHRFLRNKLLYSKYYYYFAMVSNLLLRCSWTLSISNTNAWPVSPTTFSAVVASLEVIRRGQWNIIRLENEHLHYKEKYTATHSVQLPFANDENPFELHMFRSFIGTVTTEGSTS